MSDKSLYGVDPVNGRSRWNILDHTGPSSYATGGEPLGQSVYGGPNPFGLASYDVIVGGISDSGNYRVDCIYGGPGVRSFVKLIWTYSGLNGNVLTSATVATAGAGYNDGVYDIAVTGGGGTGGRVAIQVSGGTIVSASIAVPGENYTSAPTVPLTALGTPTTPGSVTVTIGSVSGDQVSPLTDLSGETVRLLAIGG